MADQDRSNWITVEIDSLAFGGEGVGRVDGKVRFVAGALPGERVLAEPVRSRRQYEQMRLREILTASPDRLPPRCPHTAVCGGCSLQTLRYERQIEAKAQQVRELLARVGRVTVPEPHPPLPSPLLEGYRNKMEFTFAGRGWCLDGPPLEPTPTPALGLHVPGRFDAVFDLERCILPGEPFLQALNTVRNFARAENLSAYRSREDSGLLRHLVIREGQNTGEVLVALVTREMDDALHRLAPRLAETVRGLVGFVVIVNRRTATIARGDEEFLLFGRPYFRETLRGLAFELSAQSFFQTNTRGAEVLVDALARMAEGHGGRLLDLYCGAGTLGLALAQNFDSVLGVEQVASAVSDAERNAARNGIPNARFLRADVEAWIREPEAVPEQFDVVIVDPPRAGLHPKALKGMIALGAPTVLYVSCNPSTLARDAATMIEAGYRADELQIVDLFPHTAHVESIVRFTREG
ncbi:MAG: 23S rRNA (uracil(1939)-C(5))-methyltransferase RlmD [Candidatus Eisenbacteria bacterium]|nr:23S rRNA (uracil(1939)-C(5))-methyltransferase RlmD [Candidatus Eisenbacteria bacterium]